MLFGVISTSMNLLKIVDGELSIEDLSIQSLMVTLIGIFGFIA